MEPGFDIFLEKVTSATGRPILVKLVVNRKFTSSALIEHDA